MLPPSPWRLVKRTQGAKQVQTPPHTSMHTHTSRPLHTPPESLALPNASPVPGQSLSWFPGDTAMGHCVKARWNCAPNTSQSAA